MVDVHRVELVEPSEELNQYIPHFWLLEVCSTLLVFAYLVVQVSTVTVFHHDTSVMSQTYHRLPLFSSKKASLYEMIEGCRILAKMRTSLRAFCCSLSLRLFILTRLRA